LLNVNDEEKLFMVKFIFSRSLFLFALLFEGMVLANGIDTTDVPNHKAVIFPSGKLPAHSRRAFPTLAIGPSKSHLRHMLSQAQHIRAVTDDVAATRAQIDAVDQQVTEENRFVDVLDEASLIDLPIGLKSVDFGFLKYTILIDSLYGDEKDMFLSASMVFQTPNGRRLHFRGSDIRFSRNGGLTGEGKLMLVGDYQIPIDSGRIDLFVKGEENRTFVEFDCRGYKQLSLQAALVFSRELVMLEKPNGEIDSTKNVAVDFVTTVQEWSDILVNVNVPKFQVTGVKDVSFEVKDAILDFSDVRNPLAMVFPQGYDVPRIGADVNLWRGVYIRDATITLPPYFKKKNVSGDSVAHRISFRGNNMLIDEAGFTGLVSANNLIPLNEGDLSGWSYSLETLFVQFVSGSITSGGLTGRIQLSIAKGKSTPASLEGSSGTVSDTVRAIAPKRNIFQYTAIVQGSGNYLFSISNPDTLDFDLWGATVKLHPSSYLEINIIDKKFHSRAILNGEISINTSLDGTGKASASVSKNVTARGIRFEQLKLQTVRPYITVGMFALTSSTSEEKKQLGGFSFSINEIGGFSQEKEVGLLVGVTLAVSGENKANPNAGASSGGGEKADGFGATGRFKLIGEEVENAYGKEVSYKFKKIQIESFGVDVKKGSFSLQGVLNFYREDPVYGNGISGNVTAEFSPGIKIQTSAIFGTKNGFRYWYADGLATFNNGITVFTGFAFYGFGGGAYHHMKIDDAGVGSALGRTASGITYVPDSTMGLGIKATLVVGVQPGKEAFNGDVTFEVAFNNGGGVRYISLRGNGYFITPPLENSVNSLQEKASSLATAMKSQGSGGGDLNEGGTANGVAVQIYGDPASDEQRASVWASAYIIYDFDNRTLHGNLSTYINVAGGLIKGPGPNGRAGEAVLHFSPGEWYIYVGRPEFENRFAIEVMGIARLDAYFVIGSVIPDTPPPPQNVSDILGGIDLDYMGDLNALADGSGIGFGASFSVNTGDINFLIFYGRFSAGLGFDIMLKDYGDVQCAGRGQLGINGWYANAQAYAYFEGEIGINVRIWKVNKRISILNIGTAVVAQAKLPNPVWIKGIAGGYFSVLGGAVKGNCRFEIEIGEECQIVQDGSNSVLESLEILADATPQNNLKDIDVFTTPQAVFNYEMGKEYEVTDLNGNVIQFRISLDAFTAKSPTQILESAITWNSDKSVAVLNPFEILPGNQRIDLQIKVSFQEKRNGSWVVVMEGSERLEKTYQFSFATGSVPDFIPANNVTYSYPLSGQVNFYKDESRNGYITLKQGQSYLFENKKDWTYNVSYRGPQGVIQIPIVYVSNLKEIQFAIPQSLLNEKFYKLSIIASPKESVARVDANVEARETKITINDDVEVSLRSRVATGTLQEKQGKELYSSNFRVSKFNTLPEKIQGLTPSSGWRDPILPGVHVIGSNIGGAEPFSESEIVSTNSGSPLIQLEAVLEEVPWFNKDVYPIVYEGYPYHGLLLREQNRRESLLGNIPTKAVFIYQYPNNISLQQEDVDTQTMTFPFTVGKIDYTLAPVMYYDYQDLSAQAANYLINKNERSYPRLTKLLTNSFPVLRKGNYWITINYVLPGKNQVSSSYRMRIQNPFD
jgi:hypothetical protein